MRPYSRILPRLLGALALAAAFVLPPAAPAASPAPPAASAPGRNESAALLLLRETVTLLEESYVTLPDMRKAYGEGLAALGRAAGKDKVEVTSTGPRSFRLRSDGEQIEARIEGSSRASLQEFEQAYRFALGHASGDKREMEIMYEALGAMVTALDPYSSFMPPERFRALQEETSGRYGGIGLTISQKDGKLIVVSPLEDSPASKAGIEAGDEIVSVDGEPVDGRPLPAAVRRMRGPPATEVRLGILRKGWSEPRVFTLTRALVHIQSVKARFFEGGWGYIRLSAFHEETSQELERVLSRLRRVGAKGLILDLRNNPGGLLVQSVRSAEHFLPEGSMVVFTRGRHRGQAMHFRTHADGLWTRQPMVVLINKGSASASEIVAGALQDLDRAYVVGATTFGKGSVQTILPLSHGAGIRLTTAKYYTPLGREIDQKGVSPDLEVAEQAGAPPRVPPKASWPEPVPARGEDPALDAGLEILREAGPRADMEALRLAALRVRARRTEGVRQADVPAR
ncbi:MAG: S41 family peptidase [Candidatus Tectomicrobia bacterium]|uniref:S41 family peptidase n=1 Tax=Tectimicrobiota bacterium TaxID=2528274 RepID=A0A932I3K1_UNCTE|nr:S41 family peptidase [Candidatus Tectomicrobia bacterium]